MRSHDAREQLYFDLQLKEKHCDTINSKMSKERYLIYGPVYGGAIDST